MPPKFGGTLTVSSRGNISSLNPAEAITSDSLQLVSCLFETLLSYNPAEKTEKVTIENFSPILLEELPEISEDGLKYSFKLKQGIAFHNGRIFTSLDVLHTFKKLLRNKKSPYHWLLSSIKGTTEFRTGKTPQLAGFNIIDSLRFEITLSKVLDDFLIYLSLPPLSIISSGSANLRKPIGTGPFKYVKKTAAGDIILTYNSNYHKGRPYLDGIIFRNIPTDRDALFEYKTKRLDMVKLSTISVDKTDLSNNDVLYQTQAKRLFYLWINDSLRPYDDPEIRCAISSAIERKALVNVILKGRGAIEKNISSSNLKNINTQRDITFPFWFPSGEKNLKLIAEKVQHDLFKLGIKTKIIENPEYETTPFFAVGTSNKESPAFLLNSIPYFYGMYDITKNTLAEQNSKTNSDKDNNKSTKTKSMYCPSSIFIFSIKENILSSSQIKNITYNGIGMLNYQDIYLR